MLPSNTLRGIAAARVQDAEVLLGNARWDGARYVCGYAVELQLKARIADTLKWPGYPENAKEFQKFSSFKTHDLDVLLALSGEEQNVKSNPSALTDWSIVNAWNPEVRYQPIGTVTPTSAQDFIHAAKRLIALI